MASPILPSTDSMHRSHHYPLIQHKNQPPCGTRTGKHQQRTDPPPKAWRVNIPGSPLSPKAQGSAQAPDLTGHFQNLFLPHTFFPARCKNQPWPEGS